MATRLRPRWQTRLERDFTLGMIRDSPRTGIPPGGLYDAKDVFVHRPGVAFKRGGVAFAGPKMTDATFGRAVAYAPFPAGPQLVAWGDDNSAYVVTPGSTTKIASDGTSIVPIDKPTFFSSGAESILVFCDKAGLTVPVFYDGQLAHSTQAFPGGATSISGGTAVATEYTLTTVGPPTSGSIRLAITDNSGPSPLLFITGSIAYNSSAANVKVVIDATLATFGVLTCTTSGGNLPTAVLIGMPVGLSLSIWPGTTVGGYPVLTNTTGSGTDIDTVSVPYGRFSATHLQRLVMANSSLYPSRIWFSPLLNVTRSGWDLANSWIDVDAPVTAIASLQHELLVFTQQNYYRLVGNAPPPDSDMTLEPVSARGCSDARSITVWEGKCIYANPAGVFLTAGVQPVSLMEDRIESYWQSLFDGYVGPLDSGTNWSITTGVRAHRWLFVTVLNGTTLVTNLCCDLVKRAWTRIDTIDPLMYASSTGSEEDLVFVNQGNNRVYSMKGMFTPEGSGYDEGMTSAETPTAIEPLIETRPLAVGLGLKAFGDGELLYDLREPTGPPPSTKVLKADASSTVDDWVEIDLGSNQSEVWVTLTLRMTAAALAFWVTETATPQFSSLFQAGHADMSDWVLANIPPGMDWYNGSGTGGSIAAASDVWLLLEEHYTNGGATQLYVEGTLGPDFTDATNTDIRFVRIGQFNGNDPDVSAIVYIDNVKIGTTRGASNLFADDFEDGTLDAWTTTSGDVSVIDNPF